MKHRTLALAVSLASMLAVTSSSAVAASALPIEPAVVVQPPVLTLTKGAAHIQLNGSVRLTFGLRNPNTSTKLTNIRFTVALAPGFKVATPNGFGQPGGQECMGATIVALAGTTTVSMTGLTLAGQATCSFWINLVGVEAGDQQVASTLLASDQSGDGTQAKTDLIVVPPPEISAAFAPNPVGVGANTDLVFTIHNPKLANMSVTGIAFSATLPAGLHTDNHTAWTCNMGTITITAPSSIQFTGGTLAANESCSVHVYVTGTAGSYTVTSCLSDR